MRPTTRIAALCATLTIVLASWGGPVIGSAHADVDLVGPIEVVLLDPDGMTMWETTTAQVGDRLGGKVEQRGYVIEAEWLCGRTSLGPGAVVKDADHLSTHIDIIPAMVGCDISLSVSLPEIGEKRRSSRIQVLSLGLVAGNDQYAGPDWVLLSDNGGLLAGYELEGVPLGAVEVTNWSKKAVRGMRCSVESSQGGPSTAIDIVTGAEDTLAHLESTTVLVQPRLGLTPGEYKDIIVCTANGTRHEIAGVVQVAERPMVSAQLPPWWTSYSWDHVPVGLTLIPVVDVIPTRATLHYRWVCVDDDGATEIPGADQARFTPTEAEIGCTLRLDVAATVAGFDPVIESSSVAMVSAVFVTGDSRWEPERVWSLPEGYTEAEARAHDTQITFTNGGDTTVTDLVFDCWVSLTETPIVREPGVECDLPATTELAPGESVTLTLRPDVGLPIQEYVLTGYMLYTAGEVTWDAKGEVDFSIDPTYADVSWSSDDGLSSSVLVGLVLVIILLIGATFGVTALKRAGARPSTVRS